MGKECYQQLVSRGQGWCCWTSYRQPTTPLQKTQNCLVQHANSVPVEKPWYKRTVLVFFHAVVTGAHSETELSTYANEQQLPFSLRETRALSINSIVSWHVIEAFFGKFSWLTSNSPYFHYSTTTPVSPCGTACSGELFLFSFAPIPYAPPKHSNVFHAYAYLSM